MESMKQSVYQYEILSKTNLMLATAPDTVF